MNQECADGEGVIPRLLTPADPLWTARLASLPHDVYHLPGYVRLSAQLEHGEAIALDVGRGDAWCFLPLVLRPLPDARGAKLCDVASPYGYPGPLLGTPPGWSEEERSAFLGSALDEGLRALKSRGVLTAFVRFNPLLPLPLEPFARRGEIVRHGNTVAIDLRLPDEEIRRQMRPNHRRGIERGKKLGHEVLHDAAWQYLDDFVGIYHETMSRVQALEPYYFPREYFLGLREAVGSARLHLFVVRAGADALAAALFTETAGIVQYHLGGTRTHALELHPHKLLYGAVCEWAKERGNRFLHLGGGLGGREDSLFHFKAGFSDLRQPFHTWRQITDPDGYREYLSALGIAGTDGDYFPAYRRARARPPTT